MIKITSKQFEELKRLYNPEIFTEAQMGAWVEGLKDTLTKAEVDELDEMEKAVVDEFNHEFMSFVKVQVISAPSESELSKGLKYDNFFIREKQVEWTEAIEKSEDGAEEKTRTGIYLDTKLNREMNRVGLVFGEKIEKSEEDELEKGKSLPIGTIHNGYKKIAEGKWRKVSEYGMTKEEHVINARKFAEASFKNRGKEGNSKNNEKTKLHAEEANKLDSKDYSDEDVTGGDKKSYSTKEFDTKKEAEKRMSLMNSNSEYSDLKINKTSNNKYTISFKKSFSESTLSKSEQTESQSEAGIEMKKSEDSDIEKGGEGSRGGKVIGHTRSGKPIYADAGHVEHKHFDAKDHFDSRIVHQKRALEIGNKYGDKKVVAGRGDTSKIDVARMKKENPDDFKDFRHHIRESEKHETKYLKKLEGKDYSERGENARKIEEGSEHTHNPGWHGLRSHMYSSHFSDKKYLGNSGRLHED